MSPENTSLSFSYADTSTFFSITPEGHFVVRGLRLLSRVPAQMEVPASDTQLTNLPSLPLPLPNPFKAMKSRRDQAPHGAKDRLTGRIAVDQENDLGELLPGGSLSDLRTCHTGDKLLGIAWSPQQLAVSNFRCLQLVPDFSIRHFITRTDLFACYSLILWPMSRI
jgi:hypothetical protein